MVPANWSNAAKAFGACQTRCLTFFVDSNSTPAPTSRSIAVCAATLLTPVAFTTWAVLTTGCEMSRSFNRHTTESERALIVDAWSSRTRASTSTSDRP